MASNLSLDGRVAIVTGASRGIGLAVAEMLASHGASVVICSRAPIDNLEAIATTLPSASGAGHMVASIDVRNSQHVSSLYQRVFQRYRRLDILVNNAGVLGDGLIGMIAEELIEKTIATNLKGAIYNLQSAARLMRRARSGAIVNVSSIIGVAGNPGQIVYGASKAALIGLTRSASKELAPSNIRVNAVAPGYIDTSMIAHLDAVTHSARLSAIGMGRIGTSLDVANVILFLVSDLSSYTTGQVIGVDGGMVI